MNREEIFITVLLSLIGFIAILVRLICTYIPIIKNYKNLRWHHYITILLFETKCEYCDQIAVRRSSPGPHFHCTDNQCSYKASRGSWTPFGSSNGPIDGSLGWKLNKEYYVHSR